MIPKGEYISELRQGDAVRAVFMVSEKRILTARNGKQYARLTLTDKTGEITAIIWDDARKVTSSFKPGAIAGVRGVVEAYDERLQIRITKITPLNDDDVDISTLIPTSSRNMSEMLEELQGFISGIKDPHLAKILKNIFNRNGITAAFAKSPAAKLIHHNYAGGLIEHTLTLAEAIDALYPIFSSVGMNRDLLIAGALLHDIGKIYEYSFDRVINITPVGRLLGHVYISAHMVDKEIEAIDGFPDELRLQLIHIILSHHGELEFGSPKLPMTKEAMFLHMIDDLDAKIKGFSSLIEATPRDEIFSAFSRIYNRYIYTRGYPESNDKEPEP